MTLRVPRAGRRLAFAVSMAAVAAVASGCTSAATAKKTTNWANVTKAPSPFSALVKAAQAEGSVTLVGPFATESEFGPAANAFTRKYGVKVTLVDEPSSVAGATIESQEQAGKVTWDVVTTSNRSQLAEFSDRNLGYLEKYTPLAAKDYPAASEIRAYAYPINTEEFGIGWNTDTTPQSVQKQLESGNPYKALLSSSLKGKIGLIDANAGGAGMSWYSNLIYHATGYGWPYLQKLAAQAPAISSSAATLGTELEAGTLDVINYAVVDQLGVAAAARAPVRFVMETPGATSDTYEAIIKGAPHPAAARLFEEWSESLPGQEVITVATGATSQARGWKNKATYLRKLKWYKGRVITTTDISWQTDARLEGNNLASFLAKWSAVFHHSN